MVRIIPQNAEKSKRLIRFYRTFVTDATDATDLGDRLRSVTSVASVTDAGRGHGFVLPPAGEAPAQRVMREKPAAALEMVYEGSLSLIRQPPSVRRRPPLFASLLFCQQNLPPVLLHLLYNLLL